MAGKTITPKLLLRAAQVVGARLTARLAAKNVPPAGQAVAALIGYSAVRYDGSARPGISGRTCRSNRAQAQSLTQPYTCSICPPRYNSPRAIRR